MKTRNDIPQLRGASYSERLQVWQKAKLTSFQFKMVYRTWIILIMIFTVFPMYLYRAYFHDPSDLSQVFVGFIFGGFIGFTLLYFWIYPELYKALNPDFPAEA